MPMRPTRAWTINCRDCKQRISKLLSTGHIINDASGPGGARGEDHICPNRLHTGSAADSQRIAKTLMCHRCLKKFRGRYVDCPFCFKLICQRCGFLQDWLIDTPKNTCNKCGHKYLDWIEVSKYIQLGQAVSVTDDLNGDPMHLIVTGTYVKKTADEITYQPVDVPEVKQIFDCARYGHILRPGDKFCRVYEVGVIR